MAFNEIEDKYLANNLYLPAIYIFWPVIYPFLVLSKWLKNKKFLLA